MKTLLLLITSVLFDYGLSSPLVIGGERAPRFTSVYTNLETQCKAVAAGEAPEGVDMPLRCEGYGGYEVRIDFSAASSHLRIQLTGHGAEDSIDLATQPLNYDVKRKIEWRLADEKPFAVIFRVDQSTEGVDPAEMWRPENKRGELLLVKGLKGYEHIDFAVDARSRDANAQARDMADRAYLKGR
jgi:hypothetical protein